MPAWGWPSWAGLLAGGSVTVPAFCGTSTEGIGLIDL